MTNIDEALKTKTLAHERRKAEFDMAMARISSLHAKKDETSKNITVCTKTLELLETVANSRRSELKGKIESIVTEALRAIYGSEYRLEMTYSVKANRSDLTFEVVKNTQKGEVRRELGGFGLGVADAIAVPLRLLVLVGTKNTDKVCFLDESYKHAYEGDIEEIGKFLASISHLLGVQIVLCTHHPELKDQADTVYEVSIADGTSTVSKS
jgi:DNA repair exonuclease SbcCD ATPase subunit